MTTAERELTDAEIVAIRDDHLPSQGEGFDCIAFARAILQARAGAPREPTEAMCIAGAIVLGGNDNERSQVLAIEVWEAMLDAATAPDDDDCACGVMSETECRQKCAAQPVADMVVLGAVERCAKYLEAIGRDWRLSGEITKFYAAEYLAKALRELYAAPSPPGPSDEANQGAQPAAWMASYEGDTEASPAFTHKKEWAESWMAMRRSDGTPLWVVTPLYAAPVSREGLGDG